MSPIGRYVGENGPVMSRPLAAQYGEEFGPAMDARDSPRVNRQHGREAVAGMQGQECTGTF
jgi:hypothetical protein